MDDKTREHIQSLIDQLEALNVEEHKFQEQQAQLAQRKADLDQRSRTIEQQHQAVLRSIMTINALLADMLHKLGTAFVYRDKVYFPADKAAFKIAPVEII